MSFASSVRGDAVNGAQDRTERVFGILARCALQDASVSGGTAMPGATREEGRSFWRRLRCSGIGRFNKGGSGPNWSRRRGMRR